MENKKILITGTNGSLGLFLVNKYKNPICITRENPLTDEIISEGVDTIIHCAFNSELEELQNVSEKCYKDNIDLTYSLVKVPHKKFIYISSIQVAPKSLTPYAIFKRISEHIIQDKCKDYLILRVSCFLPQPKKQSSFFKIVNGEDITLTEDSVNDVIYCENIYDAIKSNLSGIRYLVSRKTITTKETSELFNSNTKFGTYHYDVGDLQSDFDIGKTSKEILKEFFDG
jgi:dTDP-4-dehydrorhamnose reductase|tara:strand:- start:2083 stop:2766 length:684 start_codon:yes stop_codon:yes gene_type:complete